MISDVIELQTIAVSTETEAPADSSWSILC